MLENRRYSNEKNLLACDYLNVFNGLGGPVIVSADGLMLKEITTGNVRYIIGGIGENERKAMEKIVYRKCGIRTQGTDLPLAILKADMPSRKIHIGTSGWHYDHWVEPFYPKDLSRKNYLSFYADRLFFFDSLWLFCYK